MKEYFIIIIAMILAVFAPISFAETEAMKTLTMHTLSGEEANYNTAEKRLSVMVISRQTIYTIERPWLPNQAAQDGIGVGVPFESSVPLGEYDLVLRQSPSKGLQWHFYNPDIGLYLTQAECSEPWHRYSTMFHVANYVRDVVGCAGPGYGLHDFGGSNGLGVSRSGDALKMLKAYLEGEERAKLVIR